MIHVAHTELRSPEEMERRRYALLQAAAAMRPHLCDMMARTPPAWMHNRADPNETARRIDVWVVDSAEHLLAEIESRESGGKE